MSPYWYALFLFIIIVLGIVFYRKQGSKTTETTTSKPTSVGTTTVVHNPWQIAFNVPNGMDVKNQGDDDHLSVPDAIAKCTTKSYDGFMTIVSLPNDPNHNYYTTASYNFGLQGSNLNDGTVAETYRSRFATSGYSNWMILFNDPNEVVTSASGIKWVDDLSGHLGPKGSIAKNLSAKAAVAAVISSGLASSVFIMNYNAVTGEFELIKQTV